MAMETGCLHGAVGQRRETVAVFASISTTSLVSVRFAYTLPSPADAPYSGLPPSGMLAINVPARGSITVEECASPFNVKTRFDALSKTMASASSAAGIRPSTLKLFRSNMTTDWSLPDVANPCPVASAIAVPCAPWMPVISPSNFPLSSSTTITRFCRAMNKRWFGGSGTM